MENKRLKAEVYWEWRTTITEMQLEEQKFKTETLQVEVLNKEIENSKLKYLLAKVNLTTSKEKVEQSKRFYKELKEKIEKDLDISLNNKIIDDVTFEIKELE